jgi:hypothetical protein
MARKVYAFGAKIKKSLLPKRKRCVIMKNEIGKIGSDVPDSKKYTRAMLVSY